MPEKKSEERKSELPVPRSVPAAGTDLDKLFKKPPPHFSYPPEPAAPVLQAISTGKAATRDACSNITLLVDGDPNWPFAFGYVWADGQPYITGEKGQVQIPLSGPFQLEVQSENPAVRVVDGRSTILSPFILRYDMPGPGSWNCIINQQQWGFCAAIAALQPYFFIQRNVPGWGWQKIMARLVYPDLLYPECFCEPSSIVLMGVNQEFGGKPLIHLKDHGDWDLIVTHMVEEYAHAVHFLELTEDQRVDVTGRYIAWLIREILSGNNGRHSFDKRTDEMVAYLEGWDAFFTNKVLPNNPEFQESNVINAFNSALPRIPVGDGGYWEVCIAALLHQIEKQFGFAFVFQRYARSRSITFNNFKDAWQRDEPSTYGWLVAEARRWQLLI